MSIQILIEFGVIETVQNWSNTIENTTYEPTYVIAHIVFDDSLLNKKL